jgi:hypothetical protein
MELKKQLLERNYREDMIRRQCSLSDSLEQHEAEIKQVKKRIETEFQMCLGQSLSRD